MRILGILAASGCAITTLTALASEPMQILDPALNAVPTSFAQRWARSQLDAQTTRDIMPPWEELAYSSGIEFPQGPVMACYAEGTPLTTIALVENALGRFWGDRYNAGNSWNGTAVNTVYTIRWSFVPDGLNIPSGVGEPAAPSTLFASMDAKFGGNRALWISKFQQCFDRWGQITGLNYVRVTAGSNAWDDGAGWGNGGADNARGDVRISMHNIDNANGILAYCSFPSNGDMVIDSSESWGSSGSDYRFLRNTVMHEHGHGIGLFHVCPTSQSKLMEPFLSTNYDGPQQDDIRAGQYLYGDVYEPNGTVALATDIGALAVGGTINPSNLPGTITANTSATSIANGFDVDFFKFTTSQNLLATITVTPIGTTYDSSAQNADGSCGSGNNINALSMSNLAISAYASNGTTQLVTQNSAAAGAAEVLNNVLLSPPGTFYARVSAASVTSGQNQLYRITVNGTSSVSLTATNDTFKDRVDAGWTTIPAAAEYRIYRGTTTTFAAATLLTTNTGAASNTYTDAAAVPGRVYYYWVTAGVTQPGSTALRYDAVGGPVLGKRRCGADFNIDGSVDFFDYLDFVDAYTAGTVFADYNGDSSIDFFDYLDFVDDFSVGCG